MDFPLVSSLLSGTRVRCGRGSTWEWIPERTTTTVRVISSADSRWEPTRSRSETILTCPSIVAVSVPSFLGLRGSRTFIDQSIFLQVDSLVQQRPFSFHVSNQLFDFNYGMYVGLCVVILKIKIIWILVLVLLFFIYDV